MDKKTIFLYIGILIVVLFILKSVFERIGLIKSAEQKAIDSKVATLTTTTTEYYQPSFHKKYASKHYLSGSEAKKLAEAFHESMFSTTLKNILSYGAASLGTSTSKFNNALTAIKSKVKFSQVAAVYSNLYKADLYTDILSELSDSELLKFANYIESLPTT